MRPPNSNAPLPFAKLRNRDKLWEALGDGTLDMIATDHSPCPPAMKLPAEGDFLRAWGGISSLQLGLRAVWTEARERGCPVALLAKWLCRNPARLAGVEKRKGSIAVGCDADFVIWDTEATLKVRAGAPAPSSQSHPVRRPGASLVWYKQHFCAGV